MREPMAVDRDKIARAAQKFKQAKQFQRAIDEYKRVLAADPRDIRTRQKLIELYALAGKRPEALEECLSVAEAYADQGFYLKAIAVLKQALRVDPESPALWQQAGEMYVRQGLVGEALAAFKRAVGLLRQQGRSTDAGNLLARMEQLAPDNAAIKVHLAELYLEDRRYEDFSAELSRLMQQLRAEGRSGKLLHALEGFYEKSSRHPSVLRPLAELYIDLGETAKGTEILEEGLSREPGDRELRLLSLRAHLVAERLPEARAVARALHAEDPDDVFILEQLAAIAQAEGDRDEQAQACKALARAYGRRGMRQDEERCLRSALEADPTDAEVRRALAGAPPGRAPEETAAVDAEGVSGFGDLLEAGSDDGAFGAVQRGLVEAELYLKYGIEQKAADKLRELAVLAPGVVEIRQKLRDLCQRQGDHRGWVEEQLAIAGLFLAGERETEALRAYRSVLEVEPDNPSALQGIARLMPIDEAEQTEASSGPAARKSEVGPSDRRAVGGESIDLHIGSEFEGFADFEVSELDDIVREFKSGIAERLDEGDYDTHYNLGIAYREMGLLEDALQEFQVAARGPDKARDAYASLALVYRDLGRYGDAAAALRMALAAPSNTAEDRAAILYELGETAEAEGAWDRALQSFQKAAELDPTHRDVGGRIQRLRAQVGG
ncbi:MAG: tetratricopeptide repeat protein [Deferrisomatales bacterium]